MSLGSSLHGTPLLRRNSKEFQAKISTLEDKIDELNEYILILEQSKDKTEQDAEIFMSQVKILQR